MLAEELEEQVLLVFQLNTSLLFHWRNLINLFQKISFALVVVVVVIVVATLRVMPLHSEREDVFSFKRWETTSNSSSISIVTVHDS